MKIDQKENLCNTMITDFMVNYDKNRTKKQKVTSDALHKTVTRVNKAKFALDKAMAKYEQAQKNYHKAHGTRS